MKPDLPEDPNFAYVCESLRQCLWEESRWRAVKSTGAEIYVHRLGPDLSGNHEQRREVHSIETVKVLRGGFSLAVVVRGKSVMYSEKPLAVKGCFVYLFP